MLHVPNGSMERWSIVRVGIDQCSTLVVKSGARATISAYMEHCVGSKQCGMNTLARKCSSDFSEQN
jgi:hypothetical protein